MPDETLPETAPEGGWLADHRRAVERLRGETVEEFGSEPMEPEKLSAIALAVASLPIVVLLTPTIPVDPEVWQVALALFLVWVAAFVIQSFRYGRFETCLHRKLAAHDDAAACSRPERARFLRRP